MKVIAHPWSEARVSPATLLLALGLGACSSQDTTTIVQPSSPGAPSINGNAAEDGEPAPSEHEPLYAVVTIQFSPEGETSYLVTTPSLDEGVALDLSTAIELPGNLRIFGVDGSPTVWLADYRTPTIERWDLDSSGRLRRTDVVDFSNLGLPNTGQAFQGAFTAELGAFANNAVNELVYWDPQAMEITGTLALDIPDSNGTPPFVRNVRARPDGTVLASYYYIDGDDNLGDGAGVVAVDPNSNRIIGRDERSDCKYNLNAGQTSDGTTYFSAAASWVNNNLVYAPESIAYVPPCTLRVLGDDTGYDQQFGKLNLGELVGRDIAGSLEVVSDERAFFVAWHEELVSEDLTQENFREVSNAAQAWKWYVWDLSSPEAIELPNVEPFAGIPTLMHVDDRLFYGDTSRSAENGGLGISQYYELTPDGPRRAFSTSGRAYGIVRLR